MRKLLLIFAIVLGTMSAMAQTGTEVINKYKGNKTLTYFEADVSASKESLRDVKDSIKDATAGIFDRAFVDKFIGGVKGINTLETVVVPASHADILKRMRTDVGNLTNNGYNVISNVKTLHNNTGQLAVAKFTPTAITELVILTPIKDKNVYILCDMKGHISVMP